MVSPRGELVFTVFHSWRADLPEDSGNYGRRIFATCLRTGEDVLMQNASANLPVRGVLLEQLVQDAFELVRNAARVAGCSLTSSQGTTPKESRSERASAVCPAPCSEDT